jgi:hypothetical protein
MQTQVTAIIKGITLDTPALDSVVSPHAPYFAPPASQATLYVIFIEFVDPFSGKATQGYFSATESYGLTHLIGSNITIECENRLADFWGMWRVIDSFLTSHKGDIVQDLRTE